MISNHDDEEHYLNNEVILQPDQNESLEIPIKTFDKKLIIFIFLFLFLFLLAGLLFIFFEHKQK